jgi:hypothetical protein
MSTTLRTRQTLQISLLAVGLCQPLWANVNSPPAPRWNRQPIALVSDDKAAPATTDATASLPLRAIQTAAMQQVEAQLNREKGLLSNGSEITSLFKCLQGQPDSSIGAETNRSRFSCRV